MGGLCYKDPKQMLQMYIYCMFVVVGLHAYIQVLIWHCMSVCYNSTPQPKYFQIALHSSFLCTAVVYKKQE